VGHITLVSGDGKDAVRTGVTAIRPHPGNMFTEKVPAAIHVINGFGKATGIAQVAELGVLETPIVLTNTLSVGVAWDALCGFMLDSNPGIGRQWGTVNPVVAECNDGYLNDIRGRHVLTEHVTSALLSAGPHCEEGSVGAGTGMSCLGYKGGIGTSSRSLGEYSLGALVLANFGQPGELVIDGVPVGRLLADDNPPAPPGSIVVIVATDAPLSDRQLGRIARRCQAGIARTGSTFGNGSGDFAIAFSTAEKVPHASQGNLVSSRIDDGSMQMAMIFRATIEAVEESIINSLFAARTTYGRDGHTRYGLPLHRVREILYRRGVLGG